MTFSFLEILLAIFAGYIAKRIFPKLNKKHIAVVLLYVLSPIGILYAFQINPFRMEFVGLIGLLVLASFLTLLCTFFLLRLFHIRDKAPLQLAALTGNTGFFGLPLSILFFTSQAFSIAFLLDISTILLVYTFGVYFFSRGKASMRHSILNVFKLPVLYSIVVAVLLEMNGVHFPSELLDIMAIITKTALLIGLSIIGITLSSFKKTHFDMTFLSLASCIRFILSPLIALLLVYFLPLSPLIKQVFVFQRAMPVAVITAIFGVFYKNAPEKSAMLVLFTTILSVVFVVGWGYLLLWVF